MAMLPKEQILATRLSLIMGEWPTESRQNMVEWVQDALKEQRCHGIVAGLEMAEKFLSLTKNRGDVESMIKAAKLAAQD